MWVVLAEIGPNGASCDTDLAAWVLEVCPMSEVEAKVVRGGARAARRAARAAPLPDSLRPVRPGMAERPLQAAVRCRRAAHPSCGARRAREHRTRRRHAERHRIHDQGGRQAHAGGPADFPARAGRGHRGARRRGTSCCTARTRSTTWSRGARACISAPPERPCTSSTPRPALYRDSTTKDLYDIARVVDTLEHLHFYQRSVVCREVSTADGDGHQHGLCQRRRAPPSTWARAGCSRSTSRRASRCSI